MLDIVYYSSKTKNTITFINKLNIKNSILSLEEYKNKSNNNKYILITPTHGKGEIPDNVISFLKEFSNNIVGVISSGSINFGKDFAIAGNKISKQYKVPYLFRYELRGSEQEVNTASKIINNLTIELDKINK